FSGPEGQTYLGRDRTVNWPRAATRQQVDVALTPGVAIRGKVTEAGKPVAGARVDFWSKGLKLPDGVHFPGEVTTGPDGTFQVLLPAAPWHLVVNGPTEDFVNHKIAAKTLGDDLPAGLAKGGEKFFLYPDAWVTVDLKPGDPSKEVAITLR